MKIRISHIYKDHRVGDVIEVEDALGRVLIMDGTGVEAPPEEELTVADETEATADGDAVDGDAGETSTETATTSSGWGSSTP